MSAFLQTCWPAGAPLELYLLEHFFFYFTDVEGRRGEHTGSVCPVEPQVCVTFPGDPDAGVSTQLSPAAGGQEWRSSGAGLSGGGQGREQWLASSL